MGDSAATRSLLERENGPSPYVEGRREFDERLGDIAGAKARWQAMAFVLAVVVVIQGISLALVPGRPRAIPYIVEVDRFNQVSAYGPLEAFAEPEQRMVVAELSEFVRQSRSVYADPLAQREVVMETYAKLGQGGQQFMDGFLRDERNNPLLLGRRLTRLVEVTSVLPVPKSNSWKVQWTETNVPLGGGASTVANWEGYFEVAFRTPSSPELLAKNPFGIYVEGINWTAISEPRTIISAPATARAGASASASSLLPTVNRTP